LQPLASCPPTGTPPTERLFYNHRPLVFVFVHIATPVGFAAVSFLPSFSPLFFSL
jgi:hypothetical protein